MAGVNLSRSLNVFDRDSRQTQLTYGQGLFCHFNDFQNNDAVFDTNDRSHMGLKSNMSAGP